MSALLPDGIDHLGDAPFTLHAAITCALRILSYEELPDDERPPKRIWLDGVRLDEHFKRVEAEREKKYGTGSKQGSDSDDPDDEPFESENAVELVKRG